ncbi:MAG TPA: ZPR1 zinc finger domain-containing protein [Methanoregula sp.]|nr:ZPR1 zinc finger domain-containing protein [Methanoregula sp.]
MRTVVPGPCPTCNTEIEYLYTIENIPYFSDILIISAICPSCGYRFVDTQMLKHGEPVRYVYRAATQEDLAVRVVRSMSASIEIPELGVRIDPGPTCQGFVSNIEGVLDRIVHAIGSAIIDGDAEERENARLLLEKIASVKCGELSVTFILEDPNGNSAIVSDSAEKSTYLVEPEPYD